MALEHMRKDRGGNGGHIVNVASTQAVAAFPVFMSYSATKNGIVGFTRSMSETIKQSETDLGKLPRVSKNKYSISLNLCTNVNVHNFFQLIFESTIGKKSLHPSHRFTILA